MANVLWMKQFPYGFCPTLLKQIRIGRRIERKKKTTKEILIKMCGYMNNVLEKILIKTDG